jgi:hypothetical protein
MLVFKSEDTGMMTQAKMVRHAGRLGMVEGYMLARVVPEPGRQLTCSDAFLDYRAWCERQGFAPFRETEFIRVFEAIAREAGIPLRQRGGNLSFMDTGVRDVAPGVPVETE